MKYIVLLMIIGIAVLGYSFSLKPYTNEAQFREKYDQITEDVNNAHLENSANINTKSYSEQFFKLYDEMITPKYRLEDIGITIISFAMIFILLTLGGNRIKSPQSKKVFVLLAVALPFLTSAGSYFEIMKGYDREEYPWWADSMGIPLMEVPINFIVLLFWALAHLFFIKSINLTSISLVCTISKKLNPWLILVSVVTMLLIGQSAFYGQYYYVISGFLWLYFYLSLSAARLVRENM